MKRGNAYDREQFYRDFGVSRETLDRLSVYHDLLLKWQKAVNLVAPSTLGDIWQRHFADSAQLWRIAPQAGKWADLGSGGGFPGLIIAILAANQHDLTVNLVESNARKCAFLADVARQTGIRAVIHNSRADAAAKVIGEADIVSARALAPLDELLGMSEPLFKASTVGLFPKGRDALREIGDAEKLWSFQWKTWGSRTDSDGQIIEIKHLGRR